MLNFPIQLLCQAVQELSFEVGLKPSDLLVGWDLRIGGLRLQLKRVGAHVCIVPFEGAFLHLVGMGAYVQPLFLNVWLALLSSKAIVKLQIVISPINLVISLLFLADLFD